LATRFACELYLERGEEPGRDLEDWFRAEAELLKSPAKGERFFSACAGGAGSARTARWAPTTVRFSR
jgi:hypothetical protein